MLVDDDGKLGTVAVDAIGIKTGLPGQGAQPQAMLNEFRKDHLKVEEQARKVQEQEAELKNDLRATVAHLTARLEEQAAQIQKVGARLEVTKAAPQTVSNK